ncbi:MAG: alpha-hydroxy-acid oxidizing protein, partial [Actinomycetota bacterium]
MEPRENQVAQQLISQARQDWPIGVDEWEERAKAVLSRGAFDWICGGAGEESTLRANRAAFERWRLRPRTLINTSERNSAIELFDTPSAAPFLLAPIGGQTVAHREGELAVARAAKSTGIPMLISQAASHSMED